MGGSPDVALIVVRPGVLTTVQARGRVGYRRFGVPVVYIGVVDKFPMGPFVNKGLTMKTGQTHMQRYMKPLLEKVERGEIDPSFVITHSIPIEKAPEAYKTFRDKKDGCIKVVIKP